MSLHTTPIKSLASLVSRHFRVKAGEGLRSSNALLTAANLLECVDWTASDELAPPIEPVQALRHLPAALDEMTKDATAEEQDVMRSVIGLAPWQTFYEDCAWSRPFINEIACASLVGPSGIVRSNDVALGLFLFGPQATYREHAHSLDEIYYVFAGDADWGFDKKDNRQVLGPGSVVHTAADQRHDLRTRATPILCAYTWTNDPAAPTYYRSEGPWRGGEIIKPPLAVPG
jgi:quercetin dioxygenase-like cupin family protein